MYDIPCIFTLRLGGGKGNDLHKEPVPTWTAVPLQVALDELRPSVTGIDPIISYTQRGQLFSWLYFWC